MDPSRPGRSRASGLLRLFPAFESYDFRWLWAASTISSMGFTMEMLAQGWLVLELTDSPFWVGAVSGMRGVGVMAFGLLAGVLADRVERRNLLALILLLRAAIVLGVGLLAVTERVSLAPLLGASLAQGALQAFMVPVNNVLAYDTAGPSRLLNATAARMMGFNATRVVGSLLAGVVIARLGVGWCYIALSLFFFLGPAALLGMRGRYRGSAAREPLWKNVREGLGYAVGNRTVGSVLLLSLLMETFVFSYQTMLPVIARDVLHVDAVGFGLLSAATSVGAVVSIVTVATLGDYRGMGALLAAMAGGSGLFLLLFALSPWFPLSLVLSAFLGGTLMAYDATMAALLQLLSSDAMRGRVLGLYGLTFGFNALSGFLMGVVATAVSAPFSVGLGAAVVLAWVLRSQKALRGIRTGEEPRPAAPVGTA